MHDCCGVKGRALQGLFPPGASGGTQDSPDPSQQQGFPQKGGTEQGLLTCPFSAHDISAKEIIVLKRGFFTSVSAC